MNIKKFLINCITIIGIICLFSANVSAAGDDPLYADDIKDGVYSIEVSSSSSMFKIVECKLTVADGKMTAVMTLSGKGYEKLFMGTSEEAQSADDSKFIYFTENADGKYDYTVPVKALDKDIDCAAFSKKKQEWYDRTLVFHSSSLPDNALKGGINKIALIISVAATISCTAAIAAVKLKSKANDK